MTKQYLRKSQKYKNTMDEYKISKKLKRYFQKSNRMSAKQSIRDEIEDQSTEDGEDYSWELETKMANLCYTAEKIVKGYTCTCPVPENEELALQHIDYLNNLINKTYIEEESYE